MHEDPAIILAGFFLLIISTNSMRKKIIPCVEFLDYASKRQ